MTNWRRAQMQNHLHHNTQFFRQTPRTARDAFGESISEDKAADVAWYGLQSLLSSWAFWWFSRGIYDRQHV